MRFLLILVTLVLLVGLMATGASAATVVYLDTLVNGKADMSGANKASYDLTGTLFSAGTVINDRFKLGGEYGTGTVKNSTAGDFTITSFKAGYRIVNAKAFKLDGIIATLDLKPQNSKLNATMYGVDVAQYFSTKAFLSASYVFTDGGSYEGAPFKDGSTATTFWRAKFHYFLTDNLGLTVSYVALDYKFKTSPPAPAGTPKQEVTLGGPAIGLAYKF